jgi:uncharacterized protein involved in outer membrane biogenesis
MRRLIYVVLGLIVLAAAVVLAGLQALNSAAGRGRIAAALSDALGQPVQIGGMSIGLLPAPSLHAAGIRVGGADSGAAPGVALRGLRVVPQLRSFLPGGTRTIDHVDLLGLTVSVRRDAQGRWHLPVPTAKPAPKGGAAGPAGTPVALRELRVREGAIRVVDDSLKAAGGGPTITTISDIAAELRAAGGTLTVPRFTGRLGATVVTGATEAGPAGARLQLASESIGNADLASLFALAGIRPYPGLAIEGKAPFQMETRVSPDFATFVVAGKAALERLRLGALSLQQLETSFRFAKGVFQLDPLAFTMYRGRQKGSVAIDFTKPAPVYTIKSSLEGLDVNQALSATTTMKDFLGGTARVTANVTGSGATAPAIQRSLAGTVRFEVADGVIRNFPLVARVNQAVGLTEGDAKDTRFQLFAGTATIGGGRARTDDLVLKAGELGMTGAGVLGFDQSLDFRLRAVLSAAKTQQLTQRVGVVGRLTNDKGEVAVPVTVTGSTTAPKYSVDVASVAKTQVKDQVQKGLMKLFQKP